jgi:poly-gamma-glutamate synthesis protein (capsule biosynthesis protein)
MAQEKPGPGCLTFVGDVMLARHVATQLAARQQSPWGALAGSPRLARAWVGNFEGAVVPDARASCPRRDGLCLGVEPATLAWLRTSPFRALSIANNHIDDFGPAAHTATRDALAGQGIVPVDEEGGPTMLDVDGVSWALVSVNLAGRAPAAAQQALERARLQIGLARARTGRVVVLPHWGREGTSFVTPEQERWAALFVRWGATLIAGSHAHVVQPARCDAEAALYFGMGNHLFDQASAAARDGLAVTCCPRGEGLVCTTAHTNRPALGVEPVLVEGDEHENGGTCAVDVAPPDRRWLAHPARDALLFVQPFPAAGPGAFFALRRLWSSFDHEDALRPYVFRVEAGAPPAGPKIVDIWRGTALGRPLVAARLVPWRDSQLLCALHRDDTFLDPKPETTQRVRAVYRWTGFGFKGSDDENAREACDEL